MHASQYVEGAGAVGHGVPVGEDQNWWNGKLGENFAHDNLHGWRELNPDSLPEKGGEGRICLDKSRRNLRQYPTPLSRARTCFRSRGMGIVIIADFVFAFGRTPAGETERPKTQHP